MVRVIICGGRSYTMTAYDWLRIDAIHLSRETDRPAGSATPPGPIECVYEGEADGADLCGRAWAESRGVPVLRFPVTKAEWKAEGKPAGPRRNADMRDGRHSSGQVPPPELVIAAPGGSGTADMVGKMRAAGRHVYELREPWQRWGKDDVEHLRGMDRYLSRWMERGSNGPAIVSAHVLKVGSRVVVPADLPVVYCGRGSLSGPDGAVLPGSGLLGNPLKIEGKRGADEMLVLDERDGTRLALNIDEILERYREHLRGLYRADRRVRELLLSMRPWTLLVCWCPASSPCHATVIADAAMQAQAVADIRARGLALPARHWSEYRERERLPAAPAEARCGA